MAVCSQCQLELTDHDFQNDNFSMNESANSIQHKQCASKPQSKTKAKSTSHNSNAQAAQQNISGVVGSGVIDICKQAIISQQSQYTLQSAGSCTINALETALRLQLGTPPSLELIDAVLLVASLYTSSMHSGVSDILPQIARYNDVLQCIHWQQYKVQDIHQVTHKLQALATSTTHDVSCIITKPPETIFVHCYCDRDEYVLYDSHPRPQQQLNGSHFLIFADLELLNEYLRALFPFIALGAGYGLYGDMMNQCEAHFVQLDHAKYDASGVSQLRQRILQATDYTEIQQQLNRIGDSLQDTFMSNQQRQKQQEQPQKQAKNPMEKIKNIVDKAVDKASQKIHDIFAEPEEEPEEKEQRQAPQTSETVKEQKTEDNNNNESHLPAADDDDDSVESQKKAQTTQEAQPELTKASSAANDDASTAVGDHESQQQHEHESEQSHDKQTEEKYDVTYQCEPDAVETTTVHQQQNAQQKLSSMSSLHSQKSDEFVMVDPGASKDVVDDFVTVEHEAGNETKRQSKQ